MKKVFYFSISANPWQRAALLDSAIELACEIDTEVTFLQAYESESHPIDLPFSSQLDYNLVKFLDSRIKGTLGKRGLQVHRYFSFDTGMRTELTATELQVGFEETIVKTRDSKPCIEHTYELTRHYALIHKLVYQEAIKFLNLHRPDCIFIFNGRFYREKAIWRAASDLGIKVKFIERLSPAWTDRYLEFEKPVHDIEYRCSIMRDFWAEYCSNRSEFEARRASENWFLERSQGISQAFTKQQNVNFQRSDKKRTLVTFFHSSEDELFSTNLGSNAWIDQITFLKELQRELSALKDIQLLIRVHPNLKNKSNREIIRWRELQSQSNRDNVIFVMHNSSINTYDILKESDFVITFGSTVGVEASFFGKPSLLVSKAFHESLNVVLKVNELSKLLLILRSGVTQKEISKLSANTAMYGLFHAFGGIRFRHLRGNYSGNADPTFYLNGFRLGSWKLISLVRLLEGAVRKKMFPKVKLDCSCV